jgi:hypothetical protein
MTTTEQDTCPPEGIPSPEHQPILTVGALRDLLDQLTEQGIDQNTAVVVYREGWYDELAARVEHPIAAPHEVIWLTLTPTGPADARFTPGHWPEDEDERDEDAKLPRRPAVDVVASALQEFWNDDALAYKAGEYDACLFVANRLSAESDRYAWSDASVRRAADVAFVLGQLGADQTTDRSFHAAVAAIILESEDVF